MVNYKSCADVLRNLTAQSASVLIQALLEQIPESDDAAVISVKQDSLAASPTSSSGAAVVLETYDPSIAYILEFCTIMVTRDAASIKMMGKRVYDVLQALLRNFQHCHHIIISRAAFYAMVILKYGYVSHLTIDHIICMVSSGCAETAG